MKNIILGLSEDKKITSASLLHFISIVKVVGHSSAMESVLDEIILIKI